MLNLEHLNQQFVFHVDGNDSGTSRLASALPAVVVILTLILHLTVIEAQFQEVATLILGAEVLINVVLIACLLRWLAGGKQSRYSVAVNLESNTIKARDKKNNVDLWEAEFEKDNVYLSEVRVFIGREAYSYPALVYGDTHKPVVETGVPYPEQSVLAFGEQEELQDILRRLSQKLT